ncbi:hypothetical protein RP20_CCG002671 [Aedes albopictus]|nr:hypothetical protein RP20_CCG002671 [Aedes albopictus]
MAYLDCSLYYHGVARFIVYTRRDCWEKLFWNLLNRDLYWLYKEAMLYRSCKD